MDFSEILKPGLEAQSTDVVTGGNVASYWGSGGLPVYATPAMIALMEKAAFSAVEPFLPPGWSTVGTEINIKHISATPPEMKVKSRAELVSIHGRALLFNVEAFDEKGKIGEGTHSRYLIEIGKFLEKINCKTPASEK